MARQTGIRLWVDAHLKSQWSWAGHVIRMQSARLAKRAVEWRDSLWWGEEFAHFTRQLRQRRPFKTYWFRWEVIKRYAASEGWQSWQRIAQLRDNRG